MKKNALIFILGGIITMGAVACNNAEHTDDDHADTTSMMPVETPPAAPAQQDTVAIPPADPAMDTSTPQSPKM